MTALFRRAKKRYSESGLSGLLYSSTRFGQNRLSNLYRHLISRVRHLSEPVPKRITLNGVMVEIDIYSIDKYLPFYTPPYPTEDDPSYEGTEVDALRKYAQTGDEVVVIGGGLGVTAVVASRVTDGKVTVYEQSDKTFQTLSNTIRINEHGGDITLEKCAVGTVSESTFTHTRPSSTNTISPERLPDADVYEMDCEGAELDILREMEARPNTILIETHFNREEVEDTLLKMGYDILEVVSGGVKQSPHCSHIRAKHSP